MKAITMRIQKFSRHTAAAWTSDAEMGIVSVKDPVNYSHNFLQN